jgi:putative CocE/NonD family hydrolase
MRLPYNKRVAQSYWYAPPSWYAERGFAVVVEDVRGRYRSEGVFRPLDHERLDGADLMHWIAEQPWCDGQVGSFGYSYSGLSQLLTADVAGVPVQATAPALAPTTLGEGCLFRAGVPAMSFALTWAEELGGLRRTAPDATTTRFTRESVRALRAGSLEDFARWVPGEAKGWMGHWLRMDTGSEYWRSADHTPDYGSICAAALHVGGWYDTFRAGTTRHYRALRGASGRGPGRDRLVIGPWTHHPARACGPALLAAPDPRDWDINRLQLEYFETVLLGADPAWRAPVRVSVLNSRDPWWGSTWPPPEAQRSAWWLCSRGRANGRDGDGLLVLDAPSGAPDHLVYDHGDPVPALGGDDCGDPDVVTMGPADQTLAEVRNDVLVYTSAPMSSDRLFIGNASVTLFVDTTDRETQWVARVCLVGRDGVGVNIAEGVVRSTSAAKGPRQLDLDLGPVAFAVPRGQRLRLHVTQGSHPRWGGLYDDGAPVVSHAVLLHDADHPSTVLLPAVA